VGGSPAAGGVSDELLAVAAEAAWAAGELLLDRFQAGTPGAVTMKSSPTDPVSEADRAAEQAIRNVLAARRPGDAVVGEEGADVAGDSGLRWVVDPLDGTVNYLYGLPAWTVTLACQRDSSQTLAGVVLDPVRDELFTATAEGPAFRQSAGDRLELSPPRATSLDQALVATCGGSARRRWTSRGRHAGGSMRSMSGG
jgi:myo-inositol-1(or 4)-monophosphatase